ncbi:MAG: threonylcarbamoyl-AMP synthase [Oscillospiraceae bacterium]|jgi:tRNA threonylcarbamoyl adenosine modification protein (Sua5/YciO/YrdC/YwlC family)|nr:threonylcarbamoyl-AMP synthase [Oscillospiraceae bacterium]
MNHKSLFVTLPQAVKLLQEGELVLIPTETVYGVAALASNEHAIAKLYSSKARPGLKPISWLVPNARTIARLCSDCDDIALLAAEKLHITVILNVPANSLDGESVRTQGFRIPDHPIAMELLRLVNKPIAVSSANLSGHEPAKTAAEALQAFGGAIPVLDGGLSHIGLSSTVVDFTSGKLKVIREGRVTEEEILALYPAATGENEPKKEEKKLIVIKAPENFTPLKRRAVNDLLFKVMFSKNKELLKRLVAALLSIEFEAITEFNVISPELPSALVDGKFCRLDINMTVNEKRVNLEVQVENEKNFPERSLFYWARNYTSALKQGQDYSEVPPIIHLNILDFNLFDCGEYHSEFRALEVKRHEQLTDRMSLHYFELQKMPEEVDTEDKLLLWLYFFKANSEEELSIIETLGVTEMTQAVEAYRSAVVDPELEELERIRWKAGLDEAHALAQARKESLKDLLNKMLFAGEITPEIAEKYKGD